MNQNIQRNFDQLFKGIKELIDNAHKSVIRNINSTMVTTYYEIGKLIVEDEQSGKARAEYAANTLENLSSRLTQEFGKGFTRRNLELMRQFYLSYSKTKSLISQLTPSEFNLSWTHYIRLMRISNIDERSFYEIETLKNNWSVRELERQYNSSLYERLILSKNKEAVLLLSQNGQVIEEPRDVIKNPFVLEFLGLEERVQYTESDFEAAIIDKLQKFLLELGKGFLFDSRQKRITISDKNFYIDLVFYHRILRCFVLIDLKIGEITHQDLGQIQMYVNYYDKFIKNNDENKTIGIVLCKEKNDSVVEITLPEENNQIFAAKYQLYLPSKEDLKHQLESINEDTFDKGEFGI